MPHTIWKATLKPETLQDVMVPEHSDFLCAREQHEEICVWYRCDPAQPLVARKVAVIGTGHTAPYNGTYIGTASLQGGSLMFHVFVD